MKSVGGLWSRILDRQNLLDAAGLAARGRREQPVVRQFLGRIDQELNEMRAELASGQPRCGECRTFRIHDPKPRLITAPVFRERVLHHAVMNVCGPVLDRRLTYHCYACRAGKGALAALQAARAAAHAAPWFVKLDVRRYFDSIPGDRLLSRLERVFREAAVIRLFKVLIYSYQTGNMRGLPIGTLISQHLANFYLAALDTHVLQTHHPRGYIRYMDDIAVWVDTRENARAVKQAMEIFTAAHLGLEFKPGHINRSARGMDFLGHRVFPCRIGLNRTSRKRFQTRLRGLHCAAVAGRIPELTTQERAAALTAFTSHAACLHWRRRVVRDLGEGPQAGNGCSAAEAGSTTAGTPDPLTATATIPRTGTTTSASALPQLQQEHDTGGTGPSSIPVPSGHRQNQKPSSLAGSSSPPQSGERTRAARAPHFLHLLFPSECPPLE